MRSLLLTATIVFACSSFFKIDHEKSLSEKSGTKNMVDLTVRRLSGERVIVAWHTESDLQGVVYEVLRKHKIREPFTSLGIVNPELKQDNTADYSFVDINGFIDSSYYCIKKTNVDSVVFYSITKGVAGIAKER